MHHLDRHLQPPTSDKIATRVTDRIATQQRTTKRSGCRRRGTHAKHRREPMPNVNGGWTKKSAGSATSNNASRTGNATAKSRLRTTHPYRSRDRRWHSKNSEATVRMLKPDNSQTDTIRKDQLPVHLPASDRLSPSNRNRYGRTCKLSDLLLARQRTELNHHSPRRPSSLLMAQGSNSHRVNMVMEVPHLEQLLMAPLHRAEFQQRRHQNHSTCKLSKRPVHRPRVTQSRRPSKL